MSYIAQSDVEAYLGVSLTPAGVATFNVMQPLLQDQIDNYCNRTWNLTNPITENFDAMQMVGQSSLANYTFFPKNKVSETVNNTLYPLAKGIINVTVGTAPLDMNYVVSYGTHIKLSASFPSVLLANPLGFKMIQIQYNADLSLPPAIKGAFILWMGRMINTAPDAGKEVNKVQSGTVIAQFTPDKVGGIPDYVKMVLDNYRFVAIDHV
jgi:hypothetical protein